MPPIAGVTRPAGNLESAAGRTLPRGSVWQRRLIPDVGLVVSIFTLFYCLFLYDGGRKLFRDSDSGWHIRAGEAMLANRELPRTDPYSFSRPGERWFAWEWGADVLMGAAHRADGLRGVALLYASAIAACTWLWFRLHWRLGGNFFLACLMASPMLSTVNLHWLARPHLFSWLFMLGAVLYAERMSAESGEDRASRWPIGAREAVVVFAASAAWANLHASFLFAPALALIYAAAHFSRPLVWQMAPETEWRKARRFLAASLCALLGTLANPYGFHLHAHVAGYLANKELLARIGEFQSFNFHVDGAFQILLAVGAAGLGAALALGQKNLAHFALSACLILASLRSARGLPLVALLALPLANAAVTEALRRAHSLRPELARRLRGFLAYSDRLRALDRGLGGMALAPLVLAIAWLCLKAPAAAAGIGFPASEFPVAAAGQVAKLPASARLLAPDKFGGYLIYRFDGRRKVYFDGRSDFYGVDFMKEYIALIEVRPGWQKRLDAIGFTHALLPNQYSLITALRHLGWKQVYSDEVATLLAR